jgi:anti-sigma-K factor RskA
MTHEEINDLYEFYILGAIEPEEAAEIEAHLREGCPECQDMLHRALAVTAGFPALGDIVDPPPYLRDRVIGSVERRRTSALTAWRMAYVALAASIVLLAWSLASYRTLRSDRTQLARLESEHTRLETLVQLLTNPETRTAQASAGENAPQGRVFLGPDRRFVFVGSRLPAINATQIFELWLVPATGAPRPAGLFRAQDSRAVYVSSTAVDLANTAAIAVSIEPQSGSNAPTTTPFVVVPLS